MKTDKILWPFSTLILLIFFLITNNLQGQSPDSLWQYHYGGTEDDQGFDALETDNGEYIVIGKGKSGSNGVYDAYFLRLDANGGIIWEKTYGTPYEDQIVSVCQALSGGYVVTGYSLSEVLLIWISEEGDSLGSVTYGGPSSDAGLFITNTTDQGYIALAIYGGGMGIADQVWLMKLAFNFDTVWTKKYGGQSQDYGEEVIETSDDGYLIAGRTYYPTALPEYCDPWVIKTDGNGDTLWTRRYGGNDEDMFNGVVETDDGYIFAGTTKSFGPGIYSFYAVRTDFNGDTVWTRTYGGTGVNSCYNIFKTNQGNYVLAGVSNSFGSSFDTYLVEIDPDGNLVWEDHWGTPAGNEYVYGSRATSDGGFIVAGRTNYYPAFKDEIFALKLGPAGSGINDPFSGRHSTLSCYPNPIKTALTIHLDISYKSAVSLQIYDAFGACIATLLQEEVIQGEKDLYWDAPDLAPGIYFCRMMVGDEKVVKKFVISGL